jgi:mannose-6-phosphate isomerase-like protein (cupin superfamily)
MYVLSNAQPAAVGLPGLQHATLAGSADGLRRLSLWHQSIEAGAATPPHRHDCEEAIIVRSGRGELHIKGEVHAFGPDTTLVIPANVDHQIINSGSEPLELIAAFSTSPVELVLPDGSPLPLPWRS